MKIEVLFSEVCNLSGDFQNVEYLRQSLPEADFIFTSLTDTPYFAENRPDMVLMGTMTEAVQRRVIETLRPYRDRLEKLIDDGVVFLMTGNACEVFVKHIDYVTEKLSVDGLGLFDLTAKTDLFHRYNGKFLGDIDRSGRHPPEEFLRDQFAGTHSAPESPVLRASDDAGRCPGTARRPPGGRHGRV